MPFKSKAQQRFMYAAEARGDVPAGTAKRWTKETGAAKLKALPEYAPEKDQKNLRKLRRAKK